MLTPSHAKATCPCSTQLYCAVCMLAAVGMFLVLCKTSDVPPWRCLTRTNAIHLSSHFAPLKAAVLKVPHCTSEACMQVSTPGSFTNMTQKGGSWHSEAKPGSASTPVSSPESQQPCSPLQEAASAVDEQQTSHSSSQVGRPSQHVSQQCLCALSSAAVN